MKPWKDGAGVGSGVRAVAVLLVAALCSELDVADRNQQVAAVLSSVAVVGLEELCPLPRGARGGLQPL